MSQNETKTTEENKMKLERITECYHPTKGSRWHITYSGCKASNNGLREYTKTRLSTKELEFVLNTRPSRRNIPDGRIIYTYNAE